MSELQPLGPELLCRRCDPTRLPFETTEELEDLTEPVGQDRAVEAVRFGMGVRHEGYHLFAMGPPETGKQFLLRSLLEPRAESEPVPPDACYVHDFQQAHRPRLLRLPAGKGRELKQALERLVEDLRAAIPAALESEEQRTRKQAIEEEMKERHDAAFEALREKAAERGIALVHTPLGFAFAPLRDGEILPPDEFDKLPQEEQRRLEKETESLQEELRSIIESLRSWAKEARDEVKQLFRDLTMAAVRHLIGEVAEAWREHPDVVEHLHALQADVVENVQPFLAASEDGPETIAGFPHLGTLPGPAPLRRYLANLFVDNSELEGAPVIHEEHPSFQSLLGRVEHLAHQGALLTDFHLVKAGSLQRANGGYLLIDARELLVQPYAYEGLKRALLSGEARVESLGQALSLVSTVSLEPTPMPVDVKLVLMGERRLYYLLDALDPDFRRLFKVVADFEDDTTRDAEAEATYARLIATTVRSEGLRHFDRSAVASVIERGARLANDGERLSMQVGRITELVREASYFAGESDRDVVCEDDVRAAVEAAVRREGRVRERLLDETRRGTIVIETAGERVGAVNGLSVLRLGRLDFGRPSRITARVRMGSGKLVDIEREVELGGPLHTKGVLILQGFLASRYALDHPLSLAATLVFEQSYGPIDGDSASCAELCALLSALAGVPLSQRWAMTGSVSQSGGVQAIGGVNEKIEGFYDTCQSVGASGEEGVIIPASNVKHLAVRADVVEAVREGRFRVHAIERVDEALELLSGLPAGARDADGTFPEGSFNRRVEDRLIALAERRLSLAKDAGAEAARAAGEDEEETPR